MAISKKVMLVGSFGVGKTSLFNRFLFSKFDDKYLTTIGVKVDRKNVTLPDGRELTLLVWDIAGEVTQDKVPVSYFIGANGIIYVFDLTRPSTTRFLNSDLAFLQKQVPNVVIKVVGNKKDLVNDEQIAKFQTETAIKFDLLTSAKTGEGVEDLFQLIAQGMVPS